VLNKATLAKTKAHCTFLLFMKKIRGAFKTCHYLGGCHGDFSHFQLVCMMIVLW